MNSGSFDGRVIGLAQDRSDAADVAGGASPTKVSSPVWLVSQLSASQIAPDGISPRTCLYRSGNAGISSMNLLVS